MLAFSEKQPLIHTLTAILVFFVGLLLFTVFLDQRGFIGFESRFGLFTQEMLRNGLSFFPTTYNRYYPDYPATQTILAYALSLGKHQVTVFNTILPTACASALTLVFIYLIGAIRSNTWGIYAVLFALLTFNFFAASRTVSLDQFTSAATAACFYLIYSADHQQRYTRLGWLPFIVLLSFAFRGPIGFIIPTSIVLAYYLLERRYQTLFITLFIASLVFVAGFAALLGAAYVEGGKILVKQIIAWQVTQRIATTDAQPFYYYFLNALTSYALSFPIACLVVGIVLPKNMRRPYDEQLALLRHLTVWVLLILVGLSIPNAKKIRYLLPIIPATSLIAAYLFTTTTGPILLKYLRIAVIKLCQALPLGGLILVIASYYLSRNRPEFTAAYYSITACLLLIGIVFVCFYKKLFSTFHGRQLSSFVLGVSTFIVVYLGLIEPINTAYNQTQPFVSAVEKLRGTQPLIFFQIGPDGEDIKYMVTLDKALQPKFLQTPAELREFNAPAIFIVKQENFVKLPLHLQRQLHVLYTGNLGHQKCVVFVKSRDKFL